MTQIRLFTSVATGKPTVQVRPLAFDFVGTVPTLGGLIEPPEADTLTFTEQTPTLSFGTPVSPPVRNLVIGEVVPTISVTGGGAGGRTFYVDQANGSDSNDGSSGSPLKTLHKAGDLFAAMPLADRANGRVYLRGTITEYNYGHDPDPTGRDTAFPYNPSSWTFDGVAGQPVKIMTDPAEAELAILDGSSVPQNYSNRTRAGSPSLLHIHGNNIEVDNFILQLSAGTGVHAGGTFRNDGVETPVHNFAARRIEARFTHGDGIFVSGDDTVAGGKSTGTIIDNCVAHHCQDHFNDGNSASGIKVVANEAPIIRNSKAYKNSDDGFDLFATDRAVVSFCDSWLNGYYSDTETVDNFTEHGQSDLTVAPAAQPGNGKGFKMSGSGDGEDNVAHHCRAWKNVTQGFTHNTLVNGKIYNCIAWDNGSQGFNFRNGTVLVGCAEVSDGAFFDNTQGDWPPNEYNSWDNGESLSNPHSQNNYGLTLTAADFVSLTPGHADFLRPSADGQLAGQNQVPSSFSITHPEGHVLTEDDFPGITATLGALAPAGTSGQWYSEYDVEVGTFGATSYPDAGSAYPSAEGYAKDATGGRNGSIVFVENANTTGAGSLRAALEQAGARYIVPLAWGYIDFDTTPGIEVESTQGDFTYFGQFMPGGKGLVLRGGDTGQCLKLDGTRNAIMRYLKAYKGIQSDTTLVGGGDAITISFGSGNIMLGNSVFAFGADETLNLHQPDTITVHDTWVLESIHDATHEKGDHGKGTGVGHGEPRAITLLRMFHALHDDRSPVLRSENNSATPNEYVNSYTFNHDIPPNFTEDQDTDVDGWVNVIKNVVENGPANPNRTVWAFMGKHQNGLGEVHAYVEGNIGPGRETDSGDEYAGVNDRGGLNRLASRTSSGYTLREIEPTEVKDTVLEWGGPSYVLRQTAGEDSRALVNVRDDLLNDNIDYAKGTQTAPNDFHSSVHGDAGVDTYSFPSIPSGSISEATFWSDYYNPVATARGWPTDRAGAESIDADTGKAYIELYMLLWVPDMPNLGNPVQDPPSGGREDWSLEGDENFDPDTLTVEQRKWFNRATWDMPGEQGGQGKITTQIRNQSVGSGPGSGTLIYTVGRKGGEAIQGMALGLRATGYLGFLDAICEILDAIESRLDGPDDSGKYSYRYIPDYDAMSTLDEMLAHGGIALGALACHKNRDKVSPGDAESGRTFNYGAIADFWMDYLENDLKHKWWSGDADNSNWNFSYNGGSFGSSRSATDEKWPWIWRAFRHVTWGFMPYYHALYEYTGNTFYRDWRDKWLGQMMNNYRQHSDGYYAATWGLTEGTMDTDNHGLNHVYGGSDEDYLIPSTYAGYIEGAKVQFWADGLISDHMADKTSAFVWAWMPLDGYQSMQGDSDESEIYGNSIGGGSGNGDVQKAGIPNSDIRSTRTQGFMSNRNVFACTALFHPEGLQLAKWNYENVFGSNEEQPDKLWFPVNILAGTIKQNQ